MVRIKYRVIAMKERLATGTRRHTIISFERTSSFFWLSPVAFSDPAEPSKFVTNIRNNA